MIARISIGHIVPIIVYWAEGGEGGSKKINTTWTSFDRSSFFCKSQIPLLFLLMQPPFFFATIDAIADCVAGRPMLFF